MKRRSSQKVHGELHGEGQGILSSGICPLITENWFLLSFYLIPVLIHEYEF
jgi:hypothetical protein